jgi:cation diffusion facilitator family transporter
LGSREGIRVVKWSLLGLFATALFQAAIYLLSGSAALLADTIHNVGDAATALPLWAAFKLVRLEPSRRFTYGYGRVEDLAGLFIVLIILISALAAGYNAILRLLDPRPILHLWAVAAAALVGFVGNEAVAVLRIRAGRRIGSAALVADGHHARVDGMTSLAVLCGAVGVWLGYPLADPVAGLVITVFIFVIAWESGRSVFTRLLDGVSPGLIEEIRNAASLSDGVEAVTEVRARWLGHVLHAELSVAVPPGLSVAEGHDKAKEVRRRLLERVGHLYDATVHVDPVGASGEEHH